MDEIQCPSCGFHYDFVYECCPNCGCPAPINIGGVDDEDFEDFDDDY